MKASFYKISFMHSDAILNSSLLDIIFYNRNKDYGAYALRKGYNRRLSISLLIMLLIVVIITSWQILASKNTMLISITPSAIPDHLLFNAIPLVVPAVKKIIRPATSSKPTNEKPFIVKSLLETTPPTVTAAAGSDRGADTIGPPPDASGQNLNNTGTTDSKELLKSIAPIIDKAIPVAAPEVLPQFPGGLGELIKFLKRNLNTPRDMEQGELISVKIKFVVGFTGALAGFDVVESGGEPFDNEVIRVLKKMPKWIPGKTHGENVTTYFIIPVKFTAPD